MTPDQLRALAEALLPMAAAPCFDGIDVERAADYLRAQADAQPVAWMYEHDGCVDTPLLTVNRWTKCEEPWNESPLFLHPAPAAPQAEPIDPHMIVAEDRFPDVPVERWKPCPQCDGDFDRECPICDGLGRVLATDSERAEPKRDPFAPDELEQIIDDYVADYELSDGEVSRDLSDEDRFMLKDAIMGLLVDPAWDRAWGALIDEQARKQAEPKREPLSDERIDTALQTDPVLITRLMIGSMTVGEFRAALRRLARIVERALEIGGSDAE